MSATLFIVPQLVVRFVLGNPVWDKRVRFLFYAATLPIAWFLFVPKELNDIRQVNFLQHMIGGGVSVGFVSLYFISIFKEKFDVIGNLTNNALQIFLWQAIFVYFLVSGFGVANELLEFLLDAAGIGIFSADRYDVWFDLVANTTGAMLVFILYKMYNFFYDLNLFGNK